MRSNTGRPLRSPGVHTGTAPESLAGRLAVEVLIADGRVAQVEVRSSRRPLAARLLRGQPAARAAEVVPRLYSLCAGAHAVAAQQARGAALGIDTDAAQAAAWTRRLETEIARETLWRVLIDWPRALDETPDPAALAALRAAQPAAIAQEDAAPFRQIVERHVLGAPADRWFADDSAAAFAAWASAAKMPSARFLAAIADRAEGRLRALPDGRGTVEAGHRALGDGALDGALDGASDTAPEATRSRALTAAGVALLPSLADARVAEQIGASLGADPGFAERPVWQGAPAETGALARLRADPRIASLRAAQGASPRLRWTARLIELARIAAGVASAQPLHGALALAAPAGRRGGLGWAESARGVLTHCVWTEGDAAEPRVTDYRVLAPTEWNFHPRGVLATTLIGQRADAPEALRERAQRLIDALDPCVACTLHVREEAAIA